MLNIRTPREYINKPGLLAEAGEHIARYGKKAVVVGSKTAFKTAGEKLFASLKKSGIDYTQYVFEGYPSERVFSEIQKSAAVFGANLIIGLGGGKVMDSVKAAGNHANLPVVAVPTIAATCASWAAVTIKYDDAGAVTGFESNANSAVLILADTEIIAAAPERYLKAGISDTLAKFYEVAPNLPYEKENLNFRLILSLTRLTFEEINKNVGQILTDIRAGKATLAVSDAIDMILYHAGLVGSFSDGFYGGFAHTFYNAITKIPGTRDKLHGEKVAFGLLVQFALEGKGEEELLSAARLFKRLSQPVTLEKIGIQNAQSELTDSIIGEMADILPYVKFLTDITTDDIRAAILKADEIGKKLSEV